MRQHTSYSAGKIFQVAGKQIWAVARIDGSLRKFNNEKQAQQFSDKVKAHITKNPKPPAFQFIMDALTESAIDTYGWLPKDPDIKTLRKRYGRTPTTEEIRNYGIEIGEITEQN